MGYRPHEAQLYSTVLGRRAAPASQVARVLADLTAGGNALELGSGSGRVAIPLQQNGCTVTAIDNSPTMLAQLRASDPTRSVRTILGDMGGTIQGTYDLIYSVFNSFLLLVSREQQAASLSAVCSALSEDGVALFETFVPDLSRWTDGSYSTRAYKAGDYLWLEFAAHDESTHRIAGLKLGYDGHIWHSERTVVRYLWPIEIDELASEAGLRRLFRWSDWTGANFGASATSSISAYVRSSSKRTEHP